MDTNKQLRIPVYGRDWTEVSAGAALHSHTRYKPTRTLAFATGVLASGCSPNRRRHFPHFERADAGAFDL